MISWPPLNPIAKRRYREKSFGKGCGISRSDLTQIAIMPTKKNKTGGLRIFEVIKLNSIGIC
jgi:hypothetical protein